MLIYAAGFVAISLLQLTMYLSGTWPQRALVAWPILICQIGYLIVVVLKFSPVFAGLFVIFGIYSIFNLSKVIYSKSQTKYLYRTTLKTTIWLAIIQTSFLLANWVIRDISVNWSLSILVIVIAQAVTATYILFVLRGNIASSKNLGAIEQQPSSTLPSITVAIPARNETKDLEECLDSLIASKYPKLEIIVLDDNSQTTKTPEIIRSYAHAGVIFVAGKQVPDGWLAKNYAYQELVENSNGEIFVFCGVDTRFGMMTLNRLIEYLSQNKLEMLSIMPKNEIVNNSYFSSMLLQPARYAWELCLPRTKGVNPAALSTVWAISKSSLTNNGGFKAVKHSISPEKYFAKSASVKDKYKFILSNSEIEVISKKSQAEQYATSIRVRYPSLHRRIELIALTSLAQLGFLVMPFLIAIISFVFGFWQIAGIATFSSVVHLYIYGSVTRLTYRKTLVIAYFVLPVAAMLDIFVLNYSMWLYEFRQVIWKGRNVALPVMHVEPRLPSID